jgi:hypothetical protein
MLTTRRPLEEKMALFWHGLFATGFNKCDDPRVIARLSRKEKSLWQRRPSMAKPLPWSSSS